MNILIIILLVIFSFWYYSQKIQVSEQVIEKRKARGRKVKYVLSLSSKERFTIFEKYDGSCIKCNRKSKLNFYIENDCEWSIDDIVVICSECKGYSVGFEYNRKIPLHTQNLVNIRDNYCCTKCGTSYNLTFDHIIPYSKGGASADADNIQLLCRSCNSQKGTSFT